MNYKEWMQWGNEIHEKPDQQKRITSAKSSKTTPSSVDKENLSGTFPGSGATPYTTTLTSCTCIDFSRRHLPCKHIYRLAIELGVLNETAQTGMNKNTYLASQFTLEQAVAELENLTDSAQHIIKNFLNQSLFGDLKEITALLKSKDLCLLQCPLLECTVTSPEETLHFLRRNQIIKILDDHGITGFKRNTKHEVLIEWCINNVPNYGDYLPEVYVLKFAELFGKAKRKTYTYLLRKYDWDAYYDGNMNRIEYPHGAKFENEVISINYTSEGVFSTSTGNPNVCHFPDDDITALLTLYGHNRCLNGFLAEPKIESK